MKKTKNLILLYIVLFLSSSVAAQGTALDEILKEKSNLIRESEQNSDSLKRLNDEKKVLIDKLLEVNKQYDEIIVTQTQKKDLTPIAIDAQEISKYIEHKRMGRCTLSAGEEAGEYIVKKDDIKIRFAFLPKTSTLSPKLSFAKGEHLEELLQIEQPGYNPHNISQKGDMLATIRFRIDSEDSQPKEIVHAVFMGQRINDKWFGKSSYKPTNVTCVLGK